MKTSKTVVSLSFLIAILAAISSSTGLFWQSEGSPFAFTTLHGQTVQMYGQGLYRFDTFFKAPIFLGTDAIMLFMGVPLLLLSIFLYRGGSLRGGLLLVGLLTCFLYYSASMAFGAAYNRLFLLYVATFSASFFAFVLALTSIDLESLPGRISPRMPHRGIAVFMFVAALSPLVWLVEAINALITGVVPAGLASYTTDITTVIDVGLIVPASILAGVLVLRRSAFGYPLAALLLTLLSLIGMVVVGQTVAQTMTGVELTGLEFALYVIPFVTLSLVAIGLVISIFGNISEG
ncbi:MAG: hypothetical protein EHM70_18955 [Chloroflexota bacterium]|nr:MAG: hypothetical protein EHM70_18955 [Chloroflexota bacterium]